MLSRALPLLAAVTFCTAPAQAYCRTHTLDGDTPSCESCPEIGLPIAWPTRTIGYAFNERGFPNLDNAELRDIIAVSASAWERELCDDEPVGIDLVPSDLTTTLAGGPEEAEPNTNVIVHYDEAQWDAEELPNRALAITWVWFDKRNGRILGADMMFNGGMDTFGPCTDSGCTENESRNDLQNVATHEFGHFLGLAHSPVSGSTMACSAAAGEVIKRSLERDDIDGLCEVYPPTDVDSRDAPLASTRSSGGCQLTPGGASGCLPLLLLLWRRRRSVARR